MGNALQVHCRQAILQQLNPQLKPLVKDEDVVEIPPFLFGECFASVAKECLAVLKKSVCQSAGFSQEQPQKYAWGAAGMSNPRLHSKTQYGRKAWHLPRKEMTRNSIPCIYHSEVAVINTFA